MPEAKRALELALREAIRLGVRGIGHEHVLLGIIRLDATSTELLRAQAIDPRRLRDAASRERLELRRREA